MPDLDLEPKDYRAQPLKGEPAFAPGGLRRLTAYAAIVLAGIVIATLTHPIATLVSGWLRSLMG